jgi:DNA-binding PadR family transcriptional regulator
MITNAELIVLSLITEKPCHGYELEQIIEERGMRNWTDIAFSSIYFLLNKLVREGLATSTSQPAEGRGPAKRVYSTTREGQAVLKQGVYERLSNPDQGRRAFMFGLSCLPIFSQKEQLAALLTRRQIMLARQKELQQHPALNQPGFPPHVKAMFAYSIPLLQAELDWLEIFIQDVKNGVYENGQNRPAQKV